MALAALFAFIVAGVIGAPAAGLFDARDPFADPSSQSARAEALIQRATGAEVSPGVVAVVAAPPGSQAVTSVARFMRGVPGVATVAAPAAGHPSPLVSSDGESSVVAVTLRSGPNPDTTVKAVESALHGHTDVILGGADVAGYQIGQQALADLGFAELLAFPLLFILALLIFRGVAAILPLAVGGMAILVTFMVLRLVNEVLPLSVFALNLVIGLGLGLSVDYSLFLVSRFREELAQGSAPPDALRATLLSTGRTVIFSALTVAAALACLTVFPQRFLVSMGLGGAVVALAAAASALLVLPCLFILMASRLARVKPPSSGGAWYRLAHVVMRRPILFAGGSALVLLLLASAAPRVTWSGIDASVLPHSKSASVAQDLLDRDFPGLHGAQPILVVATAAPSAEPELASYASRVGAVEGVSGSNAPRSLGDDVWVISLSGPSNAISPVAQATIHRVRAEPAPVPVRVGGSAADFYDQRATIAATLPLALGLLVVITLFILWLMTGSVILPFKTLLMNGLTAAAATGVLVLIFQDGRFTGPLDYIGQGGIEETDFLILAALVFALSTDYGVFLLARIKESRRPDRSEREAVAVGMERTGRLITYASLLLATAIGAFATSRLVFLKEVGVGTAVAVLLDAFLVRALLVPSLMALLGRWNWWSPPALQRLHARLGFAEAEDGPSP